VVELDAVSGDADPVQSVSLGVSDLAASLKYWHELLGMTVVSQSSDRATLTFSEKQAMLELVKLAEPIDHAEAFGRIAFSCPQAEVHTHTHAHTH
jgi:catechol-2,3-dioxygenase